MFQVNEDAVEPGVLSELDHLGVGYEPYAESLKGLVLVLHCREGLAFLHGGISLPCIASRLRTLLASCLWEEPLSDTFLYEELADAPCGISSYEGIPLP